jgi:hypothetical protein
MHRKELRGGAVSSRMNRHVLIRVNEHSRPCFLDAIMLQDKRGPGRPPKRARNISGLLYQPPSLSPSPSVSAEQSENDDGDSELEILVHSRRVNWQMEAELENSDLDDLSESDAAEFDFDDEEFGRPLAEMAAAEDEKDTEWLPGRLRSKTTTGLYSLLSVQYGH